MKTLVSLVFAAATAITLPAAGAASLTGTWQGSFDLHGTSMPLTFHLADAGGALTGTIEGLPTTPAPIHDGKIDAGKISFSATTEYQGQTFRLDFTGQVSAAGDEIAFTMATDDGSWSSPLVAHRNAQTDQAGPAASLGAAVPPGPAAPAASSASAAAPGISGTWKGSFDFQGSSVPVTFHFATNGDAVSGTVEGMVEGGSGKPLDIQGGKLDGDTLTFWLNTTYQGDTYKIVYSGKVADGKIQFTFGTDDGSWSTDLTATR